MSKTINRVEIQGHVGRDAEQKSEKAPVKFSIATGGDTKPDRSGKYPLVFHNITVWEKPETLGIKKGDYLRVVGRLNYNLWTDKEGAKRITTEIIAYEISAVSSEQPKPITPNLHGMPLTDEDVPF
jgi:single-strand DNA-binding protein